MCVNYLLRISILLDVSIRLCMCVNYVLRISIPVQCKWLLVWEVTVVIEVAICPGRSTPPAELSPWVGVQVWVEDILWPSHEVCTNQQ